MKVRRIFEIGVLVVVFAVIFSSGIFKIISDDLFMHLRTGELILEAHRIPDTDPFSFTAGGNRWTCREWLYSVILFKLHEAVDLQGLILIKSIIIMLGAFVVYRLIRRRNVNVPLAGGVTLLAFMAMRSEFFIGPHLFTYLFLPLILLWIFDLLDYGRKTVLLSPLLMIAWVNLHGGFIFGLLLLIFFLCGEVIAWKWRSAFQKQEGQPREEASIRRIQQLGLAAGGSIIGALLNPGTIWTILYPFPQHNMDRALHSLLPWWNPPLSPWRFGFQTIFSWFWVFWMVVIVSVLITLVIRRRVNPVHLILVFLLAWLSVRSRQYITPLCLVGSPFVASTLQALAGWVRALLAKEDPQISRIRSLVPVGWILLIVLAVTSIIHVSSPFANMDPGLGLNSRFYPEKLAAFLKEARFSNRLYHQIGFGSYFIWKLFPDCRIFLDSRVEIYNEELFLAASDINRGTDNWDTLLNQFEIDVAVVNRSTTNLIVQLHRHPDWKLVYWDDVGIVFVRADKIGRQMTPAGYFENVVPYDTSLSFITADNVQIVVEELNRKLSKYSDLQSYLLLGLVHEILEDAAESIKHLNVVVSTDPRFPGGIVNLARMYANQEMYDQAQDILLKGLDLEPNNPLLHDMMGFTYERLNQPEEAERYYMTALDLNPLFEQSLRNHLRLSRAQGWLKQVPIRGIVQISGPSAGENVSLPVEPRAGSVQDSTPVWGGPEPASGK